MFVNAQSKEFFASPVAEKEKCKITETVSTLVHRLREGDLTSCLE